MRQPNQIRILALLLAALTLPMAASAATPTVDAMRDHRRIVLIAAPGKDEPAAARQKTILAHWRKGAEDRDISIVDVAGADVTGAADDADRLRRRYRLDRTRFQVLLIGKDGHVALRSTRPVPANRLQQTIDAMPMRRDGGR